jgi:probable HAF family extracellular repeat protein
LRGLAVVLAGAPALLFAQFSEIKMGEYLHYATVAASGGVYAGYDSIGWAGGSYGTPSVYDPTNGWVDLPCSMGFNTSSPFIGQSRGISRDGTVVAGYMSGVATNGIGVEYAVYWVNRVESIVPAPPDDLAPTTTSATGISGDGTTLIVQDQTSSGTESYVFNIASGTFTSLGFLGGTNQHTYATAINKDGSVVTGYFDLDNGTSHGFIWTASTGLTDLGVPAAHPNLYYLEPTCISDDGKTLFGQLTELNGWVGFRYNTTTGFQDLGGVVPSACTADGTEAVGIESMYFPAIWSAGNGSGFLDHLVSANIAPQALGTLSAPVTISPDGSAVTCDGPDVYLTEQIWYGAWKISLPVPLKTAAIPPATQTFSTPYQETLSEPAGTLIQYAEFTNGATAVLVSKPHYASSFVLNADGSFVYKPKPGYISAGLDPENGTPDDSFTYKLTGPNGTSTNAKVVIIVTPPSAPTVDIPPAASVVGTTASLDGIVLSDGGAPITGVGVVYSPDYVNSNPQIGGTGVTAVAGTGTNWNFAVDVGGLAPDTGYYYAAYASNSVGIGYSQAGFFVTAANFLSWQQSWFPDPSSSAAGYAADPYGTGVPNFAVFAFLGPYQNPSTASPAQLPQVQLSGGNLVYSFNEPDGVSGVTYGAQWSGTLQASGWQGITDTGDPSAIPPLHVFSLPVGTNACLFMQLTVGIQ